MDTLEITQHTPGPWNADDLGVIRVITGGPGRCTSIAEVPLLRWANAQVKAHHNNNQEAADWCSRNYDESNANARLIAAAPDLLAALEGCLGYFDYMRAQKSEFTPDESWLVPLKDAVAKATQQGKE